ISKFLNFEMSKCLISIGHTVCIFFLLESSSFTLTCSHNFISQFLCHAASVSFTAVTNQPFDTERHLTIRPDFRRNLEGGSTNTTAFYFHSWSYISQRFFPYFISFLTGNF